MEELYNRLKTGERLRNKRKKIGWSQERAAEMMNLSAKYYADIERGTCGIKAFISADGEYVLYGEGEAYISKTGLLAGQRVGYTDVLQTEVVGIFKPLAGVTVVLGG